MNAVGQFRQRANLADEALMVEAGRHKPGTKIRAFTLGFFATQLRGDLVPFIKATAPNANSSRADMTHA
jgi:hypothetical protein